MHKFVATELYYTKLMSRTSTSYHPLSLSPSLPPSLCCSVFENNTSLEGNQDTSAIAAFRFPTVFSGYNNFTGNVGGGITLLNTRMEVNGSLWFQANRAVFGAGLAMDDRCLVSVHIFCIPNCVTSTGNGYITDHKPRAVF